MGRSYQVIHRPLSGGALRPRSFSGTDLELALCANVSLTAANPTAAPLAAFKKLRRLRPISPSCFFISSPSAVANSDTNLEQFRSGIAENRIEFLVLQSGNCQNPVHRSAIPERGIVGAHDDLAGANHSDQVPHVLGSKKDGI